ncbi:MAG: hypothetical protein R3A51_08425, partial [Nannocystaceae bacterium]
TDPTTDTTDATSDSDSDSTGDMCNPPPPFAEIYWVADADVVAPMVAEASQLLPGNPIAAHSDVEGEGTVTFHVDIACQGTYYAWGLAFDGTDITGNPDSYWVSFDGGQEILWSYGCGGVDQWGWDKVDITGQNCSESAFTMNLDPGPHTIRLRNREDPGFMQAPAYVAAIVVSDDGNFNPNSLYAP